MFLLNVVPLFNWAFMFSNVVGAGLMAVDMEKRGTLLKGAAVQVKLMLSAHRVCIAEARRAFTTCGMILEPALLRLIVQG